MHGLVTIVLLAALQFGPVDRSFELEQYSACRDSLTLMLSRASGAAERSEVLWRLSRVSYMLGDAQSSKEERRARFNEGIAYADEAIRLAPSNINAYMWHCANTGYECQTHSLADQAKAVPAMTRDLETILDKLGRTDCSEAWQALAELFYAHPLKSKDKAINYARRAVETIPRGELRLSTYLYLATLLEKRGWSSSRRASEIASDAAKYPSAGPSNTDKTGYWIGSKGADPKAVWSDRPLRELSDREEALAIVRYAWALFEGSSRRTKMDYRDFRALTSFENILNNNN